MRDWLGGTFLQPLHASKKSSGLRHNHAEAPSETVFNTTMSFHNCFFHSVFSLHKIFHIIHESCLWLALLPLLQVNSYVPACKFCGTATIRWSTIHRRTVTQALANYGRPTAYLQVIVVPLAIRRSHALSSPRLIFSKPTIQRYHYDTKFTNGIGVEVFFQRRHAQDAEHLQTTWSVSWSTCCHSRPVLFRSWLDGSNADP